MRILKSVRDGAALLDRELGPGWEDKVDLETLELSSTCNCILGQVYRPRRANGYTGFTIGRKKLDILGDEDRYGFDSGTGRNGRQITYDRLNKEWKRLIGGRRAAKLAK